jgi:hypothetical protein
VGPAQSQQPRRVTRTGYAHLSVLVGALSMARAVDDLDLSDQILTGAAAALKERITTRTDRRRRRVDPAAISTS